MFRRRESLHVGTDFGDDSDGSENTADTRSGLENGKFLLIGSDERKNEFFKLCFPGFKVFKVTFDYFKFTGLLRCDKAVNVSERSERNGYNIQFVGTEGEVLISSQRDAGGK